MIVPSNSIADRGDREMSGGGIYCRLTNVKLHIRLT